MKPNWLNIWTGGSAVILVGSEVLATLAATAWATSGLLNLGPVAELVLMAIAVIGALAVSAVFARGVFEVEPAFGEPADGTAVVLSEGEAAL